MAALLKLSVLLSLLSNLDFGLWQETQKGLNIFPPTCNRIESPSFDTIHIGNGYEIRRYNSTVWMSTSPIQDISLVEATRTGFLRSKVITEVLPSDGPFCESSFTVSFYVPKVKQADPPPAKGLHVQRWNPKYVAVRQFSGFVSDSNVGEEAAALQASLAGTAWAAAIEKSHGDDSTSIYTVTQCNSPFENYNRVNEIWLLFDLEDGFAI